MTRWSRRSVGASLAVVASLAVGMGNGSAGEVLAVRTIASGASGGASAARAWLATSDEALRGSLAAQVPGYVAPPEPAQPSIDWSREVVVGVILGQRSSGGYGVEVVSAKRDGSTLDVTVREKKPPPGDMTIQVLTYPWTLAAVDVRGASVTKVVARDESGRELGGSGSGTIGVSQTR
jgi:hypothetical protein